MAETDGSIVFKTDLDNADLEKQLKDAERSIDALKRKIESKTSAKSAIAQQMEDVADETELAKRAIERLQSRLQELRSRSGSLTPAERGREEAMASELSNEITLYGRLIDKAAKLDEQWDALERELIEYDHDLSMVQDRYERLAGEAQQVTTRSESAWNRAGESIRSKFSSVAEGVRSRMASAAERSVTPWQDFKRRVSQLLKQAFLFGVIVSGLNAIRNAIGSMLMKNNQFNASVQNLKAVLNGFLGQMVSAVLPVLTGIINTLAAVFERVASFIDQLFGTNIMGHIAQQRNDAHNAVQQENAQKMADYNAQVAKEQERYESELAKAQEKQAQAEERQAKAAQKLEKAQKKANQQVLAFDELNKLAEDSSEDLADQMDDYTDYADEVEPPDYSSIEMPELATDWTEELDPNQGVFQGVLDWLDKLKDRILNDVAGPFAKIREGLQMIKQGWDELVEGIRTGNLGLILEGLRDIAIGVVQTIEGTINAFLGWLDEQTGGQFHAIIVGIQEMVTGLSEFIQGVLTGDIPRAIDGLKLMVEGAADTLRGIIDKICTFLKDMIDTAFDNLSKKFPELRGLLEAARDHAKGIIDAVQKFLDDFITGAKQMIQGGLDIILGLLTGDRDRVLEGLAEFKKGVETRVQGLIDFARNLLNNAFNSLRQAIDGAFRFLSEKFPAAERLFTALKAKIITIINAIQGTVNGVINGITSNVRHFMDGLGQIIRGGIDVVVGIVTGSGERVRDGLKGIVNGFVTIIEGLVDNVIYGLVGFVNGVIDGLSVLPGVSIPSIQFNGVSLPRLAAGAVIPPNREFMAVLGDQSHGNNIEAPESLMRQVVREETGPLLADMVAALLNNGGQSGDVVLMVGRKELARESLRGMRELRDTGELGGSGIVFA